MTDARQGTDWEVRLGYVIHDVSRLRRRAFDRALRSMRITRAQWWTLATLARRDGMTQTRLAEELDLGKVAVGGMVARLERSGWIRREPDPADRRINRVFLEPKSKRLVARLRELSHELNQDLLAGINPSDLEVTAGTLDRMLANCVRYLKATDA